MLGIPLGLLVANATEWVVHKHVLHGAGKDKRSFWAFHWNEHHRASRKHGMRDDHYERHVIGDHSQGREAFALVLAVVATLPLAKRAPFFVGTVAYAAVNYYIKHKRSHLDPEWARKNLPWHYDHHMGRTQDANWCVTHPFFDHVMGTRRRYLGTQEEAADIARKAKLMLKRAAEKRRRERAIAENEKKKVA